MIGRTLSHYLIESRLGKGGMGEVFLARDLRLDRQVAIKILPEGADSDSDGERRFVTEARAASALNHPNIVTIHDFDRDGAIRFLVMERIEGVPLGVEPNQKLMLDDFLHLALQITSALGAAHAAGIVHHDIKPANLMVTHSGTVKVVDFGLARRLNAHAETQDGPTVQVSDERARDKVTVAPARDAALLDHSSLTEPGMVLGTFAYMAPEQLEGRRGNACSDVFSLGILFFELLCGERPFDTSTPIIAMASILRDPPKQIGPLRSDLPERLLQMLQRCLAKNPSERYADARDVHAELLAIREQAQHIESSAAARSGRWMVAVGVALLGVALTLGLLWWRSEGRLRWVRNEAIPEIESLMSRKEPVEAYLLAQKARSFAPDDAQLEQTWNNVTFPVAILSQPEGAEVAIRSYKHPQGEWTSIGVTPLESFRLPYPLVRLRLTKEGFEPSESAPEMVLRRESFQLFPESQSPPGMVAVAAGSSHFGDVEVELPEFWIDRYEVTNEEYQHFVDAGGYRHPEFWQHAMADNGAALTFEEAMTAWVDRTGRPGPATWELGAFPEGRERYPVDGISWYEAAAYAEFMGKQLPTVFHWSRAADNNGFFAEILTLSNFAGEGTVPVGSLGGLGAWGTYDMAGNVKEWCFNANRDQRYSLGGAFFDANYVFVNPDARPAMERRAGIGFRLIQQAQPIATELSLEIGKSTWVVPEAADEATYAVYARLLDYDPLPLDAKVEAVENDYRAWRKETVSYTAAYGGERITAFLFLPENARPPYQAVVFFPGTDATLLPSSRELWLRMVDFFVRSGRAMIYPVYQGTYERHVPPPTGPNSLRELRTQRAQDVRRTVDYLESRPDIDATRIAFYGVSLGANLAPLALATEPRFRTAVLFGGGLQAREIPPEVRIESFLPRVTLPVLLVGGDHDFLAPLTTSQRPYFDRLGTATADKKHFTFDGGHIPIDLNEAVREILAWTDQRLGTVETR